MLKLKTNHEELNDCSSLNSVSQIDMITGTDCYFRMFLIAQNIQEKGIVEHLYFLMFVTIF